MKHLFLTGPKGAGKSTALRRLTDHLPGTPTGFYTVKTDTVFGRPAVHLLHPGQTPDRENFLFFCGETADPARFDALGTAALTILGDYIIMDELGPHEEKAAAFQRAVFDCLDGVTPIYGVLQRSDSPFLRRVAAHPRVHLVELTDFLRKEEIFCRDFPPK